MTKILLVEDNTSTAKIISKNLRRLHFDVRHIVSGKEAEEFIIDNPFSLDLILLDLHLPNKDGLDIIRAVRASKINTPIVVMTQRADTETIIAALNLGADDYLTKPVMFVELQARIKSVLRRVERPTVKQIRTKNLTLDTSQRRAWYQGEELTLTFKQFQILHFLMLRNGQVVSRDMLLSSLWTDANLPYINTIDVHIRMIRKKMGLARNNQIIQTVHGVGYRFSD